MKLPLILTGSACAPGPQLVLNTRPSGTFMSSVLTSVQPMKVQHPDLFEFAPFCMFVLKDMHGNVVFEVMSDGEMRMGSHVKMDEAVKAFWDAVMTGNPHHQEIRTYRLYLDHLEKENRRLRARLNETELGRDVDDGSEGDC